MSPSKSSIPQKQKKDRLARLRASVKASRVLQDTKLALGAKGIDFYVEDVEGDWLEKWEDGDQK